MEQNKRYKIYHSKQVRNINADELPGISQDAQDEIYGGLVILEFDAAGEPILSVSIEAFYNIDFDDCTIARQYKSHTYASYEHISKIKQWLDLAKEAGFNVANLEAKTVLHYIHATLSKRSPGQSNLNLPY